MTAAAKRVQKSATAYRSIGEAAEELGLQPHVLRYWERKFTKQLKPLKRPDGRRMFRPEDMHALKAIQLLVHDRGLTLKGAAQLISEQGVDSVLSGRAILSSGTGDNSTQSPARELQKSIEKAFQETDQEDGTRDGQSRDRLEMVLAGLEDIKARLDRAREAQAA